MKRNLLLLLIVCSILISSCSGMLPLPGGNSDGETPPASNATADEVYIVGALTTSSVFIMNNGSFPSVNSVSRSLDDSKNMPMIMSALAMDEGYRKALSSPVENEDGSFTVSYESEYFGSVEYSYSYSSSSDSSSWASIDIGGSIQLNVEGITKSTDGDYVVCKGSMSYTDSRFEGVVTADIELKCNNTVYGLEPLSIAIDNLKLAGEPYTATEEFKALIVNYMMITVVLDGETLATVERTCLVSFYAFFEDYTEYSFPVTAYANGVELGTFTARNNMKQVPYEIAPGTYDFTILAPNGYRGKLENAEDVVVTGMIQPQIFIRFEKIGLNDIEIEKVHSGFEEILAHEPAYTSENVAFEKAYTIDIETEFGHMTTEEDSYIRQSKEFGHLNGDVIVDGQVYRASLNAPYAEPSNMTGII